MKQLNEIITKLNSSESYVVTVYQENISEPLKRNASASSFDVDSFFETINNSKKNYTIQLKKKNGNAFKNIGAPIFLTKKNDTVKKKKKDKSNDFGLGFADILDLKIQARERNEFEKKFEKLEKEKDELQSKYDAIREEQFQKKFDRDGNTEMLGLIKDGLKQAPFILGSLGFTPPAGSLAGADDDSEDLSEIKKELIDTLKLTEEKIDNVMHQVLSKLIASDGQEFLVKITTFLNGQKQLQ